MYANGGERERAIGKREWWTPGHVENEREREWWALSTTNANGGWLDANGEEETRTQMESGPGPDRSSFLPDLGISFSNWEIRVQKFSIWELGLISAFWIHES